MRITIETWVGVSKYWGGVCKLLLLASLLKVLYFYDCLGVFIEVIKILEAFIYFKFFLKLKKFIPPIEKDARS